MMQICKTGSSSDFWLLLCSCGINWELKVNFKYVFIHFLQREKGKGIER